MKNYQYRPQLGGQSTLPQFVTIRQIADRWQVSTETVERRIRSGELPASKLGRCVRVRREILETYEKDRAGFNVRLSCGKEVSR